MPFENFPTLTGQGFVPFTVSQFPTFIRVAVNTLGPAESVDPVVPKRYIHIGWWAFYEDIAAEFDSMPAGLYLNDVHWLQFDRQSWSDTSPIQAGGFTGFFYRLSAGVEVEFDFYS